MIAIAILGCGVHARAWSSQVAAKVALSVEGMQIRYVGEEARIALKYKYVDESPGQLFVVKYPKVVKGETVAVAITKNGVQCRVWPGLEEAETEVCVGGVWTKYIGRNDAWDIKHGPAGYSTYLGRIYLVTVEE